MKILKKKNVSGHAIEINGDQNGFVNILQKNLNILFIQFKISFGTTRGWVNDDKMLIFMWIIPLRTLTALKTQEKAMIIFQNRGVKQRFSCGKVSEISLEVLHWCDREEKQK